MSTFAKGHNKRGPTTSTVHHSKEDALSSREFELLFEGACNMRDYYGVQGKFLVIVLGRLGLRRGEVAHMRADWIDWREKMIHVPRHQACHDARDSTDPCGYCQKLARQRVAHDDDGLSFEQALGLQWKPKTTAAAREIYFGFDARLELYLERFFDRFGEWEWSAQGVNRRINRAAELAVGLDEDDVYPHALRATAATDMAARGLEAYSLMQFFGWAQMSTAERYLSRNPRNTARQIDAVRPA